MFMDEAGFGRISTPKRCWSPKGIRPIVPRHHIREYRYAYGAVEPKTGDSFFLVLPYANTDCMNIFLAGLSNEFPDDILVVAMDRASWHTTSKLKIPDNIEPFFLLPATPEMNPIEQIWKELRTRGFKNESFATLSKVVDRLCETIVSLKKETVKSITGRRWILSTF
jgi:putative transposase